MGRKKHGFNLGDTRPLDPARGRRAAKTFSSNCRGLRRHWWSYRLHGHWHRRSSPCRQAWKIRQRGPNTRRCLHSQCLRDGLKYGLPRGPACPNHLDRSTWWGLNPGAQRRFSLPARWRAWRGSWNTRRRAPRVRDGRPRLDKLPCPQSRSRTRRASPRRRGRRRSLRRVPARSSSRGTRANRGARVPRPTRRSLRLSH